MAMSAGRVLSHGPGRVFFGTLLPVVIRCGEDTPPPVALRDVTWHTCNMLAALWHVQVRITERRAGGSAEFDYDCLHSLLLDATLLRQALPRFAGTIPEHAIALAACRDRVSWLMNLVTLSDLQQRSPGLSDWQSAKLNAATILERLDRAPAWPFASLGVEEMSERVRAEAMRTESPAVAISQQDAANDHQSIEALGDGIYRVAGVEHRVTESEECVLAAFLKRPAMTERELVGSSGYSDASRILKRLATKKYDGAFAAAIRLPGGKGKGGYSVKITES